MDGFYEVYYKNEQVGKVELQVKGLYCRIICRCEIPDNRIYRLYAVTGLGRENLGVLVPSGNGFILDKQIPLKRLGHGHMEFCLSSGETSLLSEMFVPIRSEEPFLYLDRLQEGVLEIREGQIGIRITEPRSV